MRVSTQVSSHCLDAVLREWCKQRTSKLAKRVKRASSDAEDAEKLRAEVEAGDAV